MYAYGYGNPLRYADPTGYFSDDQLLQWGWTRSQLNALSASQRDMLAKAWFGDKVVLDNVTGVFVLQFNELVIEDAPYRETFDRPVFRAPGAGNPAGPAYQVKSTSLLRSQRLEVFAPVTSDISYYAPGGQERTMNTRGWQSTTVLKSRPEGGSVSRAAPGYYYAATSTYLIDPRRTQFVGNLCEGVTQSLTPVTVGLLVSAAAQGGVNVPWNAATFGLFAVQASAIAGSSMAEWMNDVTWGEFRYPGRYAQQGE